MLRHVETDSKIFVAGHRGMVGSAIWRRLERDGFHHLIGRSRAELDLLDTTAVDQFFAREQPEYVFLAAAKVGGIRANHTYPADFLYQNLLIQTNVIGASHKFSVRKLLFLGSSCIYPKLAPQPIPESALLTGPLEPTNEWYAIAKIAGIKLCQAFRRQHGDDFISAMPTNLYGPEDNYHPDNSHVLPALLRRFHEAKRDDRPEVVVWGTGSPLREFLHADDLAAACVFLMRNYSDDQFINIGSGHEISIRDLANLIAEVIGYRGRIVWDESKPDGTPRKLMDSSRLRALGWKPALDLRTGLRSTYEGVKVALDEMSRGRPIGLRES
jgi:GDP-L-fucose synthase